MLSEQLKQTILSELNLADFDFKPETTANDVPGWDSLAHLNIILAVEKSFGIKFKGSEILKIRNMGDLQKLVDSKINK